MSQSKVSAARRFATLRSVEQLLVRAVDAAGIACVRAENAQDDLLLDRAELLLQNATLRLKAFREKNSNELKRLSALVSGVNTGIEALDLYAQQQTALEKQDSAPEEADVA